MAQRSPAPKSDVPIVHWAEIYLAITIFIGGPLLYPAWYHRDVIYSSPPLPTEAAARAWLVDTERHGPAATCLRISLDPDVHQITGSDEWVTDMECNKPRVLVRTVLALLLPGALSVAGLKLALRPRKKRRRKKPT